MRNKNSLNIDGYRNVHKTQCGFQSQIKFSGQNDGGLNVAIYMTLFMADSKPPR